jgi:superfamily II DNA helicase RecQ
MDPVQALSPDSNFAAFVDWWMLHSFGKKPRPLQMQPCCDLLAMATSAGGSYPSTYVFIAPTSLGKSLCRDVVGRILCGIYWTLCPLLSLSADQVEKIVEYQKQFFDNGIRAIHIDEIKDAKDIETVTNKLINMSTDTGRVAALFSSPQAFAKPWVQKLFDTLLARKLLRLFCIDEVHIAVRHALTFRDAYTPLRDSIFAKLQSTRADKKEGELKLPVLVMTATASKDLIMKHLPIVTGLSV